MNWSWSRRWLVTLVVCCGLVILDSGLMAMLFPKGQRPVFLLSVVLWSGFAGGRRSGQRWGVASGLVLDLFVGRYFGLFTGTHWLVGVGAGWLRDRVLPYDPLTLVGVAWAGTWVQMAAVYGLLSFVGAGSSSLMVLNRLTASTAFFNAALVLLFHLLAPAGLTQRSVRR